VHFVFSVELNLFRQFGDIAETLSHIFLPSPVSVIARYKISPQGLHRIRHRYRESGYVSHVVRLNFAITADPDMPLVGNEKKPDFMPC